MSDHNPTVNASLALIHKRRREHAEVLWESGLALVPLMPQGKTPHTGVLEKVHGSSRWTPLRQRRASLVEVRAWFDVDPEANLGIITGEPSHLVVVDVDNPEKMKGPSLPPTITVESSPGRFHYYYQHSGMKSAGRPWGELLANGKLVVAAWSIHQSGSVYQYAKMHSPADRGGFAELTPLPGVFDEESNSSAEKPNPIYNKAGDPRDSAPFTPLEPPVEQEGNILAPHKIWKLTEGIQARAKTSTAERLAAMAGVPEVALKVLELCGVSNAALDKKFLCPLPGHEEKDPSASLWHKPGQLIMLHDFHNKGPAPVTSRSGDLWWPLPDVYAAVTSGKAEPLTSGERAVWWIRALHEAGYINPSTQIARDLPEDAPKQARKLYEGFIYLLSLRREYDHHQAEEAPFSWRFAAKWCGIKGASSISRGMKWLLAHGYLRVQQEGSKIGDTGKRHPTTFILGTPKENE